MLNDKEYIDWLKSTRNLINKYNLQSLKIDVKTMYPYSAKEKQIKEKDMIHIKILDNHKFTMENKIYDILEDNNEKENTIVL